MDSCKNKLRYFTCSCSIGLLRCILKMKVFFACLLRDRKGNLVIQADQDLG